MPPDNHLLVFDITHHAHYTNFLFHWLHYWIEKKPAGRVSFLVDNYLLQEHAGLRKLAQRTGGSAEFVPLSRPDKKKRQRLYKERRRQAVPFHETLKPDAPRDFAGYFDWELFCKYSSQLGATHSVMAHFDHYLPLVAGGLPTPTRFSALYLGTTFHLPSRRENSAFRVGQIREKLLLARILRHPHLHTLFFTDYTVIEPLQSFPEASKVAYLPDVATLPPPSPARNEKLRDSLNLDSNETVFLIFGSLTPRKGIEAFLAALEELPAGTSSRVCLLIAGTCSTEYREVLEKRIVEVEAITQARVVRRHEYIPDDEMPAYFHLADVIVTLYDRHAGVSSVNLLAAAARTPVLSSNWGMMGQAATEWNLGPTVAPDNSAAVAAAITRLLEEPAENFCDTRQMRRLADQHTPVSFCRAFFDRLGCPAT
jgi:glycosyltransferase involved in cell wall biosynthesis